MNSKEGVVLWINREKGEGTIRTPREFDHVFDLSEAPLHLKPRSSVSYLSVPGSAPDSPRAIQIRRVPKPTLA